MLSGRCHNFGAEERKVDYMADVNEAEYSEGELPPQDPNYDHMYEAFDDNAGCSSGPGLTGDYGASLPVESSDLIH
ncbi:MAG: hypothetical protein DMF85_15695 [Acidobacteria bacterium]|nr:MAG: hypothetical protein DMF85_15695 [Acidobacteriota bacterium]